MSKKKVKRKSRIKVIGPRKVEVKMVRFWSGGGGVCAFREEHGGEVKNAVFEAVAVGGNCVCRVASCSRERCQEKAQIKALRDAAQYIHTQ